MSKAIVLVAFGSANLEGIKNSIGLLEKDFNKEFSDNYTIVKAFTSNKVIELLKERHDYVVPHLSNAIFNLINHGYEDIIIQPLHVMSGTDQKQIQEIVDEYQYSLESLLISKVLFDSNGSTVERSDEIAKIISRGTENENILLVGHGSNINSNELYDTIEESVKKISNKNVYMATLEGERTIDKAIKNIIDLRLIEKELLSKLNKLEKVLEDSKLLANKENLKVSLEEIRTQIINIQRTIKAYEDEIIARNGYVTEEVLDKEEKAYERRKRDSECHIW